MGGVDSSSSGQAGVEVMLPNAKGNAAAENDMEDTKDTQPPLALTDLLASLGERRLELVVIDWIDAFGCPGGWEFENDIEPKVTTVRTVGFVMKDTDEFVFVVPHVSTTKDQRQFAGHMAVPKKQIINRFQITSSCQDAE